MADCRLYLITPSIISPDKFADELEAALSGGDVACLQLRLKDADEATIEAATEKLMPIAHRHEVAFLINDRPDLAAKFGADGCHVGQEDTTYAKARELVGTQSIVGVTCHNSKHLAMTAGEAGADYVAFGAFFDTATKAAKTKADIDLLTWWSDLFEIPCVAIGGITVENCRPLVAAGADFLSVISGVWSYPAGPAAAVRDFNQIFAETKTGASQ